MSNWFSRLQKDLAAKIAETVKENEERNKDILLSEGRLPLYEYQKDGVRFLHEHRRCILGDEMGLGKTLQAIAAVVEADPDNRMRVLIITTKNAKPVWKNELRKWIGEEADMIDSKEGPLKVGMKFLFPTHRFMVCNFENLREFAEHIKKVHWNYIIFDEAHKLRNTNTKMYKGAKEICHYFDLCPLVLITGTPLVNTPADLFALLHLIDKHRFSSERKFLESWFKITGYGHKSSKQYKHRNAEEFKKMMSKYMIRRESKEVLDLPPVKEITVPISLEGSQLKTYISMRDLFMASFGDNPEDTILVTVLIAQINRLKAICLSEKLMIMEDCEGAKLDALLEILEEQPGKKVITSCFAKYLRPLKKRLEEEGYKVGLITGATSEAERDRQVKLFQETDELDLFLISSKAGGESITLTAASTIIYMDKPWTAAEEDQVLGRVKRIGQEGVSKKEGQIRRIFKYYLRAEDTIEEYIEEVINRKRNMFGDSIPISVVRRMLLGGK